MSGPKRLQEEGSHSSSLKRPLEDSCTFPNSTGKVTPSVAGDYHSLFEPGQDGRLAKIQRTESRDADKRLLPIYRVVSTSNDPCLDHPISSDNRLESRDIKDIRDARSENREMKGENREFYADTRLDSQGVKGEKDVKLETRGDEKDVKSDMTHMDFKGEIKAEKDSCMGGNIHLSWKEPKEKEHHRGKRYPDPSVDGFDPWRVSCINFHSTEVVVKETSATEERDYFEAREAVGENKIDWKCEEKSKEKDRKRKDEKHRDWGERDKDRSERRNNLQALVREERETERWERERKDAGKDKEKVKDRENDHAKREAASVNEKESLHNEKEVGEGSCKFPEQETANFEQKRAKEIDGWKGGDRDARERKKERDVDGDGDRHERRGRGYEKESDEGCTEGDGAAEREREVFGYGVQQRRRMLRPRGTPQAASREPRFRSRARDNEGSQGKSEVSTVVYKVGECMQELIRLWKEYEGSQEKKNDENSLNGPTLEIRIPAEYVTATNRQVRGGQLWGTDIYTDDSDLVAVLMHTGYCRPTASPPPPAIHELRATIRVLPPQDCYISTLRNNVRSRAWGAAIGCSFRVERCCILKKGGGSIDLEPCLTHISAVEPTLAPASVERTITTRAAASNFRQQRFVREVTIQYSLCNEPWVKYSISVVADKGLKKPLYTSARLKKGEVLYVETHSNRYELCFNVERALCNGWGGTNSTTATSHLLESEPEKLQNHVQHAQSGDRNTTDREHIVDVFRWSRCKQPLPQKVMRNIGIPLPVEYLEVLEENLDWEDVQWSQTGVWVAGKEYALARVHFLSPN